MTVLTVVLPFVAAILAVLGTVYVQRRTHDSAMEIQRRANAHALELQRLAEVRDEARRREDVFVEFQRLARGVTDKGSRSEGIDAVRDRVKAFTLTAEHARFKAPALESAIRDTIRKADAVVDAAVSVGNDPLSPVIAEARENFGAAIERTMTAMRENVGIRSDGE